MKPLIGAFSLADELGTTFSSDVVPPLGFEERNAFDWLTWDGWKPTNAAGAASHYIQIVLPGVRAADYFGVYSKQMEDAGGSGVKLQKETFDGSGIYTDVTAYDIPIDGNGVLFKQFVSVSARRWRVVIDYGAFGAPVVEVIAFGARIEMPCGMQPGWTPPTLSHKDTVTNSISEGGAFLGRTLERKGCETELEFDLLLPAFVRASWEPFVQHARVKPFFFSWDDDLYPDEAALLWSKGAIAKPVYSFPSYMRASIDCHGVV